MELKHTLINDYLYILHIYYLIHNYINVIYTIFISLELNCKAKNTHLK